MLRIIKYFGDCKAVRVILQWKMTTRKQRKSTQHGVEDRLELSAYVVMAW